MDIIQIKNHGVRRLSTPKRIWYPGTSFHVTTRGNHKEDIFRDSKDYKVFLNIIKEALKFYEENNYELICYCLMTNHIHLLIKTDDKEIGHLMRRINSFYARYFNNKYNYEGHLFQRRYHGKLIKDDAQMLATSRYIHLNPVRAKIVEMPERYQWSSYGMYIGKRKERLISSDNILFYFKDDNKRKLYKEFVESEIFTK